MDYLTVLRKYRLLVIGLTALSVLVAAIVSMTLKNVYEATAVIVPAGRSDGGGSGLALLSQQFGSLPGLAMPQSTSDTEILGLLRSNGLKVKVIEENNLLPDLFPDDWDAAAKAWKGPSLVKRLAGVLSGKEVSGAKTTWDGIRELTARIRISKNVKESVISVSVASHGPEMAARLVRLMLSTLNDHMRSESSRVAKANRRYLEQQLSDTADPLMRQKMYNLIAQQVEVVMMSELKENFAFKVIDKPMAPDKKIAPNRLFIVAGAAVASLFFAITLSFIIEYVRREKNIRR